MRGIIMLHGLPGSGKSWLAERLRARLSGSVVLKSVHYRLDVSRASGDIFDENNQEIMRSKDVAYRLMIENARRMVCECCVILDGTFHKRYRREWVYALVRECGVPFVVISVSCSERVVAERLKKRCADSSADAVLKSMDSFGVMKRQADPLTEIENYEVFDSENGDGELLLGKVHQILGM